MEDPRQDKKDEALKAQRFKMLEDIARDLAGEISFPTCFDAALQIRNVLRDPNASLREIANVVRMEPLVAAKLLKTANSAIYNPTGQAFTSVESAVARIGINQARSIVMAIAMDQLLRSKDLAGFAEISKNLWTHTLKTAAAARVLARRLTRLNAEDALLAGLVHDLGAFYMLYRSTQYEELRIRPNSVIYLIAQWHESIGESLMTALGLPEHITEAVRDHDQHRPTVETPKTLGEVIYVANIIAGGLTEWAQMDAPAQQATTEEYQTPTYMELGEEIEADYAELLGALSGTN